MRKKKRISHQFLAISLLLLGSISLIFYMKAF